MLGDERWEAIKAIKVHASHINLDYPFSKTESDSTSVYGLQRLLVNRSKPHVIVSRCGVRGSSLASLAQWRRMDVKSVVLPDWVMLPIL
jgi:hypothetical protein